VLRKRRMFTDRDTIESWNSGGLGAGPFIEAMLQELRPILMLLPQKPPPDTRLEVLRQRLLRSRPKFRSRKDFLFYAKTTFEGAAAGFLKLVAEHPFHAQFYPELAASLPTAEEQLTALEALDDLDSRRPTVDVLSFAHPAFRRLMSRGETLVPLDRPLTDADVLALAATLPEEDAKAARLLVLRFFGGLSLEEIARKDNVALDVVASDWQSAQQRFFSRQRLDDPGSNRIEMVRFGLADDTLLRAIHQHPELLRTMDWRTFEVLIARILDKLGFEIDLQRGTKDGGIDIIAVKRQSLFGAHRYLIQAKRWSHRVGVEPVRELLFLHEHHKATKSCLATTSTFTGGAWRLGAEYKWQLELKDADRLLEWVSLALEKRWDRPGGMR